MVPRRAHVGERENGDRQRRRVLGRGGRSAGRPDGPRLEPAAHGLEGLVDLVSAGRAVARVLLQAAPDDPIEVRRQPRPELSRRSGRVSEDGGHQPRGIVGPERAAARRHLVEDGPQREDVRSLVHGSALHLLRRHVGNRPHHDALPRPHLGRQLRAGPLSGKRSRHLGEAEVQHLHPVVFAQHDVAGLEVAVNDALRVRGGERLRERAGDPC
jgi:hypothetical protein